MNTDPAITIVTGEPAPPPKAIKGAALARLAFGSVPSSVAAGQSLGPRHLAFLPPEALELDLGDPEQRQFGDYELVEKLGQGGMGVVYRARQRSLDREVAVKLLSAGPWASSDFIERFRREAQSAARMQHPNIVAIYEIGAHDELNFFSMRLVRGHSLAQELADGGPLPERRAAQLMRGIAEALDYAHRLGVLHLDLKPANVLIDERGEPQVADFGLARRLDETLTRDNDEVSGTPSYMAPEQAQIKSHKLSQATDIYGLGAILYELLTGRPPFLGASPQETLQRVITMEPTRPRELVPSLSRDLEAVCLKCLAKEPGERYLSARALAEDLGRWLEQRPVSVRPLNAAQRGMRWVRREPLVAALATSFLFALLAGLVATGTQWLRADANAKDARQNLWVMRSQTAQVALADGDGFRGLRSLIANLGEMEAAGKSADAEVERQRIGTVLANAPQLVDFFRLPKGTSVSSVAIAPDGMRFALAAWASDGKRTVHQYEVASGRELWSVSTNGLTHVIPMAHDIFHGEMRYTPDGSRIIVHLSQVAVIPAPTASDAIALDASDGRVLQPPDLPHADIVFNEDMRYALVRFRADDSRRFPDSGQLFATDGWRPLGPRHAHGAAIDADEWLFTPNGERLLGSSDFRRFTLFEPATLAPLWRTELPAGNLARAWRFSPDASLLALGTTTGAVFLVDTRDGHSTQLPSSPVATVRWLEFSADGATLVAQSENFSIAAWDVATRKTRAEPLPGGANSVHAPRVRVVGDTLYSPIGNQLRSWNLAPLAPFDNLAVPGAARLRSPRDFAVDAFDVYPDSRLLIAAGTDGVVGFWRLPQPALLSARAAPLPPRNMSFDGERIVVVEGNVAQLRDAITQAPRSRPFLHPEPVRFAELSFDGRALVTIAGRTVRVLDLATNALRGAPIVLPQTPVRVDIARAAPVLAVTTSEYAGDVYQERVHVVDLATGTMRPTTATLTGIPSEFNLDPLGRYVLAAFWRAPAYELKTVVRVDLTGDAHGRGDVTLGSGQDFGDFYDSEIAADGATAWTYSVLAERRIRLRRWALDDGRVLATIELPSPGGTIKLMPLGDGIVAHRLVTERLVVFDGAGRRREVPGVRREDSMLEFALSKDGRRAALATRNAVELVDLARGERLSAPLTVPIAGNDAIAKLAFSPDATRLLARTIKGRWLLWHLPMARQATSDLGRLAALLDPDGADRGPDGDAGGDLRQSLRAADPGTPPDPGATDTTPVELTVASGAEADPRFVPLDLRPALNVPLNGAWPLAPATGGDLPTLAPGMQRTNGIDWRIDGGVQLSRGGPANTIHPTEPVSPVVPVPMLHVRRVHVLTLMHMPMRGGAPPREFARVVLIGEDGRETALEILTVRDVASYSPELAAPSARIGFLGMGTGDVRDGAGTSWMTYTMAYSVGLDVPPDAGVIKGLRFEAGEGPMEVPLFYAATIELADPSGAHSKLEIEGASR